MTHDSPIPADPIKEDKVEEDLLEQRSAAHNNKLLNEYVRDVMEYFYHALEGEAPENVYQLVLEEVEKPLFEATLKFTKGNQSRAASILGLNRTTLRKKLRTYDLI